MQPWMRLRLVPLAIVLSLHALIVAAMLSALRVGVFSVRPARRAQLETVSPPATVQVFIATCPRCRAAETSGEPLESPTTSAPALERLQVESAPSEAQWDTDVGSSPPLRTTSRAGIAGVRCEVHIHQNARGRVQAIDFGSCTEDAAWQHALLRTIIQAATLATPSSAAYPPELTLTLTTNRLSAVLLARALSDRPALQQGGFSSQITTWHHQ